MKVGDLVHYPDAPIRTWDNEEPLRCGVVVGFDKDNDPIVFFTERSKADAYYIYDVEVLSEVIHD